MTKTLRHVMRNSSAGEMAYVNPPVYYDRDAYQKTIDKTVDYLCNSKDIVAIYQIGEVSEPGISDIDLIVVLENETDNFCRPYRRIFDSQDHYLFMHGIFAIPESIYERREWLIPIFDSRRLVGRPVQPRLTLDPLQRRTIETTYAMEFLFVNLFNVIRQLMARQLKVRNLLCALKALGYDFRLLHDELPESMQEFNKRVLAMRTSAFDRDSTWRNDLYDTCILAVEQIMAVLQHLSGMKSEQQDASTERSPIRVGHNAYLVRSRASQPGSGLRVTTSMLFDWISGLRTLPLPGRIARQLSDLQQGFYGTVVEVSPPVFDRLGGSCDLVRRRNDFLADYHAFMPRVHADFGIYDTFRDPARESRKWKFIRSLNQQMMRPSTQSTRRSPNSVSAIVP